MLVDFNLANFLRPVLREAGGSDKIDSTLCKDLVSLFPDAVPQRAYSGTSYGAHVPKPNKKG